MSELFGSVLEMSLWASIAAVIVIIARLCLKKVPKIFSYVLWSVVFFRLLCPFGISIPIDIQVAESRVAEDSENPMIQTFIEQGIEYEKVSDEPITEAYPYTSLDTPVEQLEKSDPMLLLWFNWLIGIAGVMSYGGYSYLKLRRRLRTAFRIEGQIYESGRIKTAFVLGFIRPRIYIPAGLSDTQRRLIVMHEHTHLRRYDHIVKLIAYCALAVHWFNPVVWLCFNLMCKDMEQSCDEAAIQQMIKRGNNEKDVKYEYGKMLLFLGGGNKNIFSTVSFAENDVAERVKNVLVNKKSSRAVTVIIGALIILLLAACLFNPYVLSFETVNRDDVYVHLSTADTEEANDPVPTPIKITIGQNSFFSNTSEVSVHSADRDFEKLSDCTDIEALHLENCVLSDLDFLLSVPSLKKLYIKNCTIADISAIGSAADIEFLSLNGCQGYKEEELYTALSKADSLKGLSYFPHYKNNDQIDLSFVNGMNEIRELEVSVNKQKDIDDICTLHTLDKLKICEGTRLTEYDWSGLSELSNLTEFTFQLQTDSYLNSECEKMLEDILTALSEVKSLRRLYINPDASMISLPASPQLWAGLSELECLFVSMTDNMDSLSFLSCMSSLKSLTVLGGSFDIKDLSELSYLESLYLRGNNAKNLNVLSKLKGLKTLNLDLSQDNIDESISYISNMPKLCELNFGYSVVFSDVSFLKALPELEFLSIHNIKEETDLSPLGRCSSLHTLIIDGAFSNIDIFGDMNSLEKLSLSGGNIVSLSPLKECGSLTELFVFCNGATDAEGLSECTNLKSIEIIAPLDSIRFINALPNLRKLTLWYANYTDSELADFAANNPYCEINVR